MLDEVLSAQAREVTKALAELGYYFTFGADEQNRPVWSMSFRERADTPSTPVTLAFNEAWLMIFHLLAPGSSGKYPPEMLHKLLTLNTALPVAKVAIDDENNIAVTAQVSLARLSADTLKEAIAAVVQGARQARTILGIPQAGEAPPTITH